MMRDVVHVVSSKNDDAHKARGYNRGRGSRRSNAFDVAPEGAEAAPRSFKGYTLGSYAPNNLAVNPPPIVPTSPLSSTSPSSPISRNRFRTLGSFSLFDEIELGGVGVASFDRHQSNGGSNTDQTIVDEEGSGLCGISLFGPLTPLLGAVTLRHVGWSSILLDSTLLIWRLIFCLFAIGTAITAGVLGINRGAFFLPFYASMGIMVCARLLALCARYKAQSTDFEAVNTPRKYYAIDALMYQTMITLQCFALVAYLIAFNVPLFETLLRSEPKFDSACILYLIFVACCVFDIAITPIPFRLLYVFPAAFYCGVLSALSLRTVPNRDIAVAALLIAFGTSFIVGLVVTIFARFVYNLIHRNRVLFALKANTPSQVLRDVNNSNHDIKDAAGTGTMVNTVNAAENAV